MGDAADDCITGNGNLNLPAPLRRDEVVEHDAFEDDVSWARELGMDHRVVPVGEDVELFDDAPKRVSAVLIEGRTNATANFDISYEWLLAMLPTGGPREQIEEAKLVLMSDPGIRVLQVIKAENIKPGDLLEIHTAAIG